MYNILHGWCADIGGKAVKFSIHLNLYSLLNDPSRSWPRRPSPFFLIKKDQKIKSAGRLLCALGICPQTAENLGLRNFRRANRSLCEPTCENSVGLPDCTALPVFPGFLPKLTCGRKKKKMTIGNFSWRLPPVQASRL